MPATFQTAQIYIQSVVAVICIKKPLCIVLIQDGGG
jgi:hypothetical protein